METPAPPYPTAPPYPPATRYPLTFRVDYPDKPLGRLTTVFRFLWIIPILVIAGLVTSGNISSRARTTPGPGPSMGIRSCPSRMLLFRQKYPRCWSDWNLQLTRFLARVWVYAALLRG